MYWSGVDKASLIFLFQASLFIFFTLTVVSFFSHLALIITFGINLLTSYHSNLLLWWPHCLEPHLGSPGTSLFSGTDFAGLCGIYTPFRSGCMYFAFQLLSFTAEQLSASLNWGELKVIREPFRLENTLKIIKSNWMHLFVNCSSSHRGVDPSLCSHPFVRCLAPNNSWVLPGLSVACGFGHLPCLLTLPFNRHQLAPLSQFLFSLIHTLS